jgi:hypothetical protein
MGRPLLVLALALGPAAGAGAQPIRVTVETLDWMAADSEVIVRAVVIDVAHEVDGAMTEWDTVVVKVRETLKGRHKPFHTIAVRNWRSTDPEELSRWKKTGPDVLVFLVPSDKQLGEKVALYPLMARQASLGGLIELAPEAMTPTGGERYVYTLDLKNLREPNEILDSCRGAIAAAEKFKPKRSHAFTAVEPPGWVTRVAPVDERLEAQARRWAASDDPRWREEGARALQYFKSAAAVAALKKLLDDPAHSVTDTSPGGTAVGKHRHYYVREAAFASLKELGVRVPEPVVRAPLPRKK